MARGSGRKKKGAELAGQGDPRAALDGAAMLAAAKPVLEKLRADLAARAAASGAVTAALEARHAKEKEARRTADGFAAWRERLLAQVAASWFLSCVFVRTLEDRGLLGRNRLAGPGATDSQSLFFSLAPSLSERDYLLFVFRELARFPAARPLFDAAHSLVWKLLPSAEVARDLLGLFRQPSAEEPAFRFGQASTRFLGDLYQDLDEEVRKRFALLQTPDFIESFILDRTLEPAIERFGLDDTTVIDPTCGSGHFLLGAFDRLFDHHLRAQPDLGERKAADLALDAVFGADINPYAVAIARFRLTVAYLEKAGFSRLADAPALPLHLVVADSLLHNPHRPQTDLEHHDTQSPSRWRSSDVFALEDESAARDVLHRQYASVVGNPPYITEKDSARRELYREMYPRSAFRGFSLGAPFCERFFQLGRRGGFVGQITANSFMKREFGKKLIEDFLKTTNLATVVNTSGAYIPGHGTPTVLLFGTNDEPQGPEVLTVLAKRGEPSTPADPSKGEVWSSIAAHWSEVGFENDYISVSRTNRAKLAAHPWSLGGGGTVELKDLLEERAEKRLGDFVQAIGRSTHTGEDNVYFMPAAAAMRLGFGSQSYVPLVKGEQVRDWAISEDEVCLFPYSSQAEPIGPRALAEERYYWTYRTVLKDRQDYGQKIEERGHKWFEHSMFFPERFLSPLSIAFAFVATHNHFVLDRGGKVFNRTAPIIKLPATATEDDHLALLAYLNSSTACFWMKQVMQPKHSAEHKTHPEPERDRYEHSGTQVAMLPVPTGVVGDADLAQLARELGSCAIERSRLASAMVMSDWDRSAATLQAFLDSCWRRSDVLRERMIALQEEIDWRVYALFGISDAPRSEAVLSAGSCPRGMRPFERVTPRKSFVRRRDHLVAIDEAEIRPTSDLAKELSGPWRVRHEAIRATPELATIETPLFKRQWRDTDENVDERAFRAGRDEQRIEEWVVRHAEAVFDSEPMRLRDLRDQTVRGQPGVETLAERAGFERLVEAAAVPFLPALRYSETGLSTFRAWQTVWELQRAEDAGDQIAVSAPPKYDSKDFQKGTYWSLRGKLDVPKEAFISYPGCESDEDGEPVFGWAGWNHLVRARALAGLYQKRKVDEGWTKERLTPMLAGLLELVPWVKQWHNEPDAEYGGLRMGDYFEQFVDAQCQELGLTRKDLVDWRPAKRGGRAAAARKARGNGEGGTKPRKGRKRKTVNEDVQEATDDRE